MSLLLDSNALYWWIRGDRFERRARARIERTTTIVSAVSVYELSVKWAAGRLRLELPIVEEIELHEFDRLAVSFEHAERAAALPLHHRDPLDRLLIAQAQVEGLTIVTRDDAFDAYDVDVLRC